MAGAYALRGYLPVSLAARILRTGCGGLRGKPEAPATRLAQSVVAASPQKPPDPPD